MYLYRNIKDLILNESINQNIKEYATYMWKELSFYLEPYDVKIPYFNLEILIEPNTQNIKLFKTYFPKLKGKDRIKIKEDIEKKNISKNFQNFLNKGHQNKYLMKNYFISLNIYNENIIVKPYLKDEKSNFSLTISNHQKQTKLFRTSYIFDNKKEFFKEHKKALIQISNHLNSFDDILVLAQPEMLKKCSEESNHHFLDYKIKLNELKNISKNTQGFFNVIDDDFSYKEPLIRYDTLSGDFSIGIRKTNNISMLYISEIYENIIRELHPILLIE